MSRDSSIDKQTFEALYKSHLRAVEAVVRKFRFYDCAADDLVQEIFIKAWNKRGNLRDVSAFSGWLMQIARNCCLNEIKRLKPTLAISGTDSTHEDEMEAFLVVAANDPTESLKLEFSLALIRQAIACHRHEIRARVARLFYVDELTVEGVAERLEMKPNTVLSHLHRFRLIVAKAVTALEKNHDFEFELTRRKLLRA